MHFILGVLLAGLSMTHCPAGGCQVGYSDSKSSRALWQRFVHGGCQRSAGHYCAKIVEKKQGRTNKPPMTYRI